MPERPLSPHVSIYRLSRYCLITSFANRITGVVLSAGLLLLLYWLTALARGAHAYARAQGVLGSLAARVVYVAVLAAFAYHLLAGVRHLIWDTGHGLEKRQSQRSAWAVILGAVVLAVLFGWLALRARTGV